MSNIRGATAESVVCTWALKSGIKVAFPARGLAPRYDMIFDTAGVLQTVQVKRAHLRADRKASLRANVTDNKGRPYDDVDYLAIVEVDSETIWLIPSLTLDGKKAIGLSTGEYDKWMVQCDNKTRKPVRLCWP